MGHLSEKVLEGTDSFGLVRECGGRVKEVVLDWTMSGSRANSIIGYLIKPYIDGS